MTRERDPDLQNRKSLPRLLRKAWVPFLVMGLLTAGSWQFGHGLYIKAKAAFAQVLLEDAWTETLASGRTVKPWPWFDTVPVAKIVVPRLSQSAIVLKSASGQAMAFGPGHMNNTPKPGERGLSVIAAHRDTHFKFLKELQVGDTFKVTNADGATHDFKITGTRIVYADQSGLDPHMPGHKIALVTCYPFDALTQGPLRYVVFGERDLKENAP